MSGLLAFAYFKSYPGVIAVWCSTPFAWKIPKQCGSLPDFKACIFIIHNRGWGSITLHYIFIHRDLSYTHKLNYLMYSTVQQYTELVRMRESGIIAEAQGQYTLSEREISAFKDKLKITIKIFYLSVFQKRRNLQSSYTLFYYELNKCCGCLLCW